jgi:hypothetical protein
MNMNRKKQKAAEPDKGPAAFLALSQMLGFNNPNWPELHIPSL